MLEGVRTCPSCLRRVLPAADDSCPSCRKYRFVGADVEIPSAGVVASRQAAVEAQLYRGALLHWRLVRCVGVLCTLFVAAAVLQMSDGAKRATGLSDDALVGISVMSIMVAAWVAFATAGKLRLWLGYMDAHPDGDGGIVSLVLVLKESIQFFHDRNVPLGVFGPRLSAMAGRPGGVGGA
jgi:hypothetical protein